MANWAAYKEKEIGLPVVKRAKHGLHFKRSDGQIQAEFVGKPCHYFDGKEYRAIDTRPLLRKDGSYGCPHSDVVILSDGTVQVGEYSQKAALIYPGKISVDGDRIARPFSGGVQYLYITENGFRQEIVLEKMPDLRKVSALVDTVKGILPTKYTASSLSLKDSSTAELSDFVQVDKVSLASVLEAARYPVTIDPDFSVQPDPTAGKDAMIYLGAPTNNYGGHANIYAGKGASLFRGLLQFDVSSIASGVTITVGTVSLYCSGGGNVAARDVKFHRLLVDWTEGTGNGAAGECNWRSRTAANAWGADGGLAGTDYATDATATTSVSAYTTWYTWNILADVQAWVAGTATNYGNFLIGNEVDYYKAFCSSDYVTDTTLRPKLLVTYTAAGTFIPVNMMANTQNLTAGMRG